MVLVASPDQLDSLPGEEDVAQTRGDRGDEVNGAHAAKHPPGASEVVEHLQILKESLFGVDRESPHLTTTRR